MEKKRKKKTKRILYGSSWYLRNRMGGNFVTGGVQVLDLAVVCPFVGHVEGRRDGTPIGVLSSLLKQIRIKTLVKVVHGIVEGQEHDLRYLLRQVVSCFSFKGRRMQAGFNVRNVTQFWFCFDCHYVFFLCHVWEFIKIIYNIHESSMKHDDVALWLIVYNVSLWRMAWESRVGEKEKKSPC